MTDKDPLSTSPAVVPTDETNDYRVKPDPPCYACGGRHGSVNLSVLCLQLHLRQAHTAIARLQHVNDDLTVRLLAAEARSP
jgi:hypothetical protein